MQGLDPDDIGLKLPDAEIAYLEAFRTAQDMWADLLKQRKDPTQYTFEIMGCQGQVVQTLPFSEVFASTKGYTTRCKLPHRARTAQELANWTRHLASALEEQVRVARESIRHSQELLTASRLNQPMFGAPRHMHSDGQS